MAFKISSDSNDQDLDTLADINIIPLVDVMLVLLIIFMVAAPLTLTGIKISLPESAAKGTPVQEKKLVLSINQRGEYYIENMKIETVHLRQRLKGLFEHQNDKQLYIRADRSVAYGVVIDAMSQAKIAGVQKINMITKPFGAK